MIGFQKALALVPKETGRAAVVKSPSVRLSMKRVQTPSTLKTMVRAWGLVRGELEME